MLYQEISKIFKKQWKSCSPLCHTYKPTTLSRIYGHRLGSLMFLCVLSLVPLWLFVYLTGTIAKTENHICGSNNGQVRLEVLVRNYFFCRYNFEFDWLLQVTTESSNRGLPCGEIGKYVTWHTTLRPKRARVCDFVMMWSFKGPKLFCVL